MVPVHNNPHCNPPWLPGYPQEYSKAKHKRWDTTVGVEPLATGVGVSSRKSPRRCSAPPTAPADTTLDLLPRLTARHPHGVDDVHTPRAPGTPCEDGTLCTRLTRTLDTPVAGSPQLSTGIKRLNTTTSSTSPSALSNKTSRLAKTLQASPDTVFHTPAQSKKRKL